MRIPAAVRGGNGPAALLNATAWRPAALLLLATTLVLSGTAHSGEIEPRAYLNAPVGVNFLLGGYSYSSGGLSIPGSSTIRDAHLKIHTGLLAWARVFEVWGNSGKIDVIVPYASLSGNALVNGEPRDRQATGLVDPRVRFSMNFIGSPALELKDFAAWEQDIIVGASLQVSLPLGQYDADRLVNLGTHRWSFRPDLGVSKAWGPVTIELTGGAIFFTTNDEYYTGSNTLRQNPVLTTQAHFSYTIVRGMWAALSANYDHGGRSSTNGVDNEDFAKNSRWGATFAWSVGRNNSLKLFGGTGVSTRTGGDFNLVAVVWQYRWGGGL